MRITRQLSTLCGLSLSALTLLALTALPARAQVVYDNGSLGRSGGFNISESAVADDFSFTDTTSFNAIRFLVLDEYTYSTTLAGFSGTLSYIVRANNFRPNGLPLPGAALFSGTVSGAAITQTVVGANVDNALIFQLDFSIPEVTLDAGTYWLQLKEGTPSSAYDGSSIIWTVSSTHTGAAQLGDDDETNPTEWGWTTFYDAQFQLRNNTQVASAAPEPGSLALLTLAGMPLVGATVRRKRVSLKRLTRIRGAIGMRINRPLFTRCGLSAGALALISLAPRPAAADLIFTNYVGESVSNTNNEETIGTEFTVGTQSLLLSRLGIYDAGGDGLLFSHPVGVWRVSDQALIASVTVPAGTGASLVQDWRFVNLSTPITLDANTTYRIAAQESSSVEGNPFDGTFSLAPGIASATEGGVYAFDNFAYPAETARFSRGFANGDVTPIASAAPEPASLALFALGTMTGSVIIRRRKAKAGPDST